MLRRETDEISQQKGSKHQQANVAIALELAQTISRVVQLQRLDLPDEVRSHAGQSGVDRPRGAGQLGSQSQRGDCGNAAHAQERLRALAEQQRGGLDADHHVVRFVLMSVDSVVQKRPADSGGQQTQSRSFQGVANCCPAHQSAPIESDAKHQLRPICESFEQWIGYYQGHTSCSHCDTTQCHIKHTWFSINRKQTNMKNATTPKLTGKRVTSSLQ